MRTVRVYKTRDAAYVLKYWVEILDNGRSVAFAADSTKELAYRKALRSIDEKAKV